MVHMSSPPQTYTTPQHQLPRLRRGGGGYCEGDGVLPDNAQSRLPRRTDYEAQSPIPDLCVLDPQKD